MGHVGRANLEDYGNRRVTLCKVPHLRRSLLEAVAGEDVRSFRGVVEGLTWLDVPLPNFQLSRHLRITRKCLLDVPECG